MEATNEVRYLVKEGAGEVVFRMLKKVLRRLRDLYLAYPINSTWRNRRNGGTSAKNNGSLCL